MLPPTALPAHQFRWPLRNLPALKSYNLVSWMTSFHREFLTTGAQRDCSDKELLSQIDGETATHSKEGAGLRWNSQWALELRPKPRDPHILLGGKPGFSPQNWVPPSTPRLLKRGKSWLSLGKILGLLFQVGQRRHVTGHKDICFLLSPIRNLGSSLGSTTCWLNQPKWVAKTLCAPLEQRGP